MEQTNLEIKEEEVLTTEEAPETKEIPEEKEVKVSPTEASAREQGWVPKEEWIAQGKDADEWRSAREFNERGELFDEIHKLKEGNKKTTAAFRALVEHHKKVRETAVKEALDKLKAEKKEALVNHEIERVFEIDEEIDRVKDKGVDIPDVDLPPEETGPTSTFKSWHKKNDWYELDTDDEASRYADTMGLQFRQKNPSASEKELLEFVESKVARRFPEVFENKNANRAPEVNPRSDARNAGDKMIKLTEAEERVCKMLVEQGVMTRKEYVEEVKKTRGA